ncbi:MAG TPA: cation diffusion facilitator family transporter [bacterium]|nr:cation diffusion facilitator family transporter [bacterium]HPQ66513.1 cation diffusion facilitator family transporter [bacterium]
MNAKKKTAALSTLFNVVLTVLKFAIYFLTGSLAVLAEAWHSLSDIVTSLLVLFSLGSGPAPEGPEGRRRGWSRLPLEARISFVIGLFILAAAVMVVKKIVGSSAASVTYPLISGLFFILFALGSFFVYQFETRVGKQTRSPGLVSDGLHSKADMLGSLIAGFALILLQLGVNADKPAAIVICVFLVSFALDTFVNFVRALRGETEWTDRASLRLIENIFQGVARGRPEAEGGTGWRSWLEPRRRAVKRTAGAVLAAVAAVGLFSLCFFTVGPRERAVRERLGTPLDVDAPLGPGFYLKLPPPLERVLKVDTTGIRTMDVGNVSNPQVPALIWTREHGVDQAFLSGDNNFFYPYLTVHYRVKNVRDYLYRQAAPEECLALLTDSLITEIYAGRTFYDIATVSRRPIEEEIRGRLQRHLDRFGTGLEVVEVNTKDIHPPISIAGAFEEVIAAMQEKVQSVNQAIGYRNTVLPQARGESSRTRAEAQSYVRSQVDTADGDAGKFREISLAASMRPALSRTLLYLRTVRETLGGKRLILVSPEVEPPDIWLGATGRPPLVGATLENMYP